jgi:hypothetical protein
MIYLYMQQHVGSASGSLIIAIKMKDRVDFVTWRLNAEAPQSRRLLENGSVYTFPGLRYQKWKGIRCWVTAH